MHLDAGYTILRPALKLDTLRLLAHDDALTSGHALPTWPAAKAALPARPAYTGAKHHARFVGNLFANAWDDKDLLRHARLRANGRLTATAIAIRLYQHGPRRRPPDDASGTRARLLPAVPIDPFAAADQPIRYVPDWPRPYLYTVGENGLDDTATAWRPSAADMEPLTARDGFVDLVSAIAAALPHDTPYRPVGCETAGYLRFR